MIQMSIQPGTERIWAGGTEDGPQPDLLKISSVVVRPLILSNVVSDCFLHLPGCLVSTANGETSVRPDTPIRRDCSTGDISDTQISDSDCVHKKSRNRSVYGQ